MTYRKRPERRTFLQDRFEILIKRQRKGQASFSELTELDEIVNRDPEIRERVIRESLLLEATDDFDASSNGPVIEENLNLQPAPRRSLLHRIKSLLARTFNLKINIVKVAARPVINAALAAF